MNPSETWAQSVWAIRNTERVFGERPRVVWDREPGLHVQSLTRSSFIAGGPVECFSRKVPIWNPTRADERDLLPIDKLYGSYCAADRCIEVYVDRIEQDAKLFGADPGELLHIVRLHEYAHAVVHLGVSDERARAQLSNFGDRDSTDWSRHIAHRTERFANLPEEVHELLAQAITFSTIRSFPAEVSERLGKVFSALEERQPEIYKIPAEVKRVATKIDWPLVLDAARGEIAAEQEDGFSPIAGIKALLCRP